MSRPSFRPRPLDLHQKLPVVRDASAITRDSGELRAVHHSHLDLDKANDQVQTVQTTKGQHEIPVPDVQVVESYAQDVKPNYVQPPNYVRFTGHVASDDYVGYDLDTEDENWLDKYNDNQNRLSPEKFESMLYALETANFHATEKKFQEDAAAAAERGSSVSLAERQVLVMSTSNLDHGAALTTLRTSGAREPVLQAVYKYWQEKRELRGKPLVRNYQLPPPVSDTNPYNVFRPRERISRPQTRRKRENDPAAREKLAELLASLEQGAALLDLLQNREKRKRDLLAAELDLLRLHARLRHDPRAASAPLHHHQPGAATTHPPGPGPPPAGDTPQHVTAGLFGPLSDKDSKAAAMASIRKAHGRALHMGASQKKKRRMQLLHQLAAEAPPPPSLQMVFALQIDMDALADSSTPPDLFDKKRKARFGRGGRIIFDRTNALSYFDDSE